MHREAGCLVENCKGVATMIFDVQHLEGLRILRSFLMSPNFFHHKNPKLHGSYSLAPSQYVNS